MPASLGTREPLSKAFQQTHPHMISDKIRSNALQTHSPGGDCSCKKSCPEHLTCGFDSHAFHSPPSHFSNIHFHHQELVYVLSNDWYVGHILNLTLDIFPNLLIIGDVCGYVIPCCVYGGWRTTLWSPFSPSTFTWVPGIKLRPSGFTASTFILSPLASPLLACEFIFENLNVYLKFSKTQYTKAIQ